MIQTALTGPILAWAAWHVFGVFAPWRRRHVRAWLARQLEPHAPARVVRWLRPGLPQIGCGCGNGCASVKQDSGAQRR
jgi:hypothetical protein